jgi:uncharacterized membrane protein
MKSLVFYLLWLALLFGACLMFYSGEYFFDFFRFFEDKSTDFNDLWMRRDIDFWMMKKDKVHDEIWAASLYLHVIGSLSAILIGPFQFLPTFRNRFLKTHRLLGKIYISAIMWLGVPTGMYMAFYANGGFWASVGFGILSLLWLFSTYFAYSYIKKQDISAHKNWMIRSYAVTFAAVTLRLWTGILPHDFGLDLHTTIVAAAWLSWIPNLIAAEIIIYFQASTPHNR